MTTENLRPGIDYDPACCPVCGQPHPHEHSQEEYQNALWGPDPDHDDPCEECEPGTYQTMTTDCCGAVKWGCEVSVDPHENGEVHVTCIGYDCAALPDPDRDHDELMGA